MQSFEHTKLTKRTQQRYTTLLGKWTEYLKRDFVDWIVDPDGAVEQLGSFPISHSPENHHFYLTAGVAYANHVMKDDILTDKWKKHQKANWEVIQERYDENRPSDLQRRCIMPYEEILKIRNTLEKGSIERLLLSLYTIMEPVRADYFATELITEGQTPKADNYITDLSKITITDFKTKGVYEKIENILPEEIQEELRLSLEKQPRNYLFVNSSLAPYDSRTAFSVWACRALTRCLKHPMTLTVLRHLYIGHQASCKSTKELRLIARKMGHSRNMQRMYEWDKSQEWITDE